MWIVTNLVYHVFKHSFLFPVGCMRRLQPVHSLIAFSLFIFYKHSLSCLMVIDGGGCGIRCALMTQGISSCTYVSTCITCRTSCWSTCSQMSVMPAFVICCEFPTLACINKSDSGSLIFTGKPTARHPQMLALQFFFGSS